MPVTRGRGSEVSRFQSSHSSASDWRAACDEAIASLDPAGGDDARLGFVYVTDPFGPRLAAIVEHVRRRTGIRSWVGSVGLGIIAAGREYFGVPALALLVADIPAEAHRIFETVASDFDGFDAAHRRWCDEREAYFAFVHADPRNPRLGGLIDGLASRLGDGYLVGGLTSSETSIVQIAGGPTSGGLSGVLLASSVPVVTRHTQGCAPIGPRREITRCERNIVIEIDGRPALDVFNEDIGEILARDLRRAAGYIFVGLPIPRSDTGDYLVRNLIGVDPRTGVLAVAQTLEPGQRIMFCRRDARSAEVDMRRMLTELRDAAGGTPKAGIYYSCLARGPNLFGPNSEEAKMIAEALGDFPLVGFFANGEISHNRLYAYTGVLTLFT